MNNLSEYIIEKLKINKDTINKGIVKNLKKGDVAGRVLISVLPVREILIFHMDVVQICEKKELEDESTSVLYQLFNTNTKWKSKYSIKLVKNDAGFFENSPACNGNTDKSATVFIPKDDAIDFFEHTSKYGYDFDYIISLFDSKNRSWIDKYEENKYSEQEQEIIKKKAARYLKKIEEQ